MDICVTGASSGIGRAVVKQLIIEGYRVWAVARRTELLNKLKKEINSEKLFISTTDVLKAGTIEKLAENMKILKFIPSAFIFAHGAFFDDIHQGLSMEIFKKNMSVNLEGALALVNAFLPRMIQEKRGHFIVLSSVAAFRPNQRGIGYPASKAAVGLAFRGLALAYKKHGVSFSTIYLGPVATEMWEGRKSFLVPHPEAIAASITDILNTKRTVVYLPMVSTTIVRILNFLSDSCYARLTSYSKKSPKS